MIILVYCRPGVGNGTSYGMFAPWSNGLTQVIFEGGYSASNGTNNPRP